MAVNNSKKVTIEIEWKPNRELQIPIYSQIVSYFSDQIINGIWTSGDYLPSQRKLSEIFGVNRSSIVEAMDELTAMGLIECSYGKKTKIIEIKLYNECHLNDVIIHFSADNFSVCFQNFVAGRNRKGIFCNIIDFLFCDVCTVGNPYLWYPCVCKGS